MSFKLDSSFIEEYSKKTPNFGFNGLGELVYMRTYSRLKDDGTNEKWFETIKRVVEGTYNLQKDQIDHLSLGWNQEQAQKSAQEMYTRMFEMKFLPPGRGLWAMGTDIVNKKGLAASLNNCGFVSTAGIGTNIKFSKPFKFLMDMCMLGVGVGFDTEGTGNFIVNQPDFEQQLFIVEDNREGWVNSLATLIDSFDHGFNPLFDYSNIRKAGVALKTFGGVSSGAQPLIDLHNDVKIILNKNVGSPVSTTTIVDIMNLIGKCVVSGNIRRCLPEGTLVHTEFGIVPIENVSPGTRVYTSNGLAETSELVYQGEQEVISIKTQLGVFECTEKHKMAVISSLEENSRGYSWKMAKDLLMTDSLVFPVHEVLGKDTCIVYKENAVPVDSRLAYLFGYFTSLDYVTDARHCNVAKFLSVNANKKALDTFDSLPKLESQLLIDFSKSIERGKNVYIPEFILIADLQVRKSYLEGFESNNFHSENLKIIDQLQALYSSVGIPAKVINHEGSMILYSIEVADTLNPDHLNLIPIKIENIKYSGKVCKTYDISVPSASEFIAGQGLLVHNTAEIAFGKASSEEFMDLKDYSKNPQRMSYGWTSNNSIFAELGMDYSEVAKRICINGEPGIAWLDNMKQYSRMVDPPDNKDYRVVGGNPCLEQSLESMELCCVSGDTRIQTKSGCPRIRDIIGKSVDVWNGQCWSSVIPFEASQNKEIFRVTLSDGSVLDCTDNHKWSIKTRSGSLKEIETKDLVIGNELELFSLTDNLDGIDIPSAYELGMFTGYGHIENNRPIIMLKGKFLSLENSSHITGHWYNPHFNEENNLVSDYLDIGNTYNIDLCRELKSVIAGLPDYIFTLNRESILKFIAGYIDTVGHLRSNKFHEYYQINGPEYRIRDLQILLRRVNINNSTICMIKSMGSKTRYGVRKYNLYSLRIKDYEAAEIPTIFKKIKKVNNKKEEEEVSTNGGQTKRPFQKIKSIEKLEIKQNTYCFTEPLTHKGVFGNVLTHQCLVESFPHKADSLDDFLRTLKFAYLYAKTVTLGLTHWEETNRVQLRNRRIGCSVSGVAQFLSKNSLHELNKWLESGYSTIQKWDRVYSEWLCIPRSIKTTSVKPSGTVSLLAGATPGMHYPESRFYIRRMRLSNDSPLVDGLIKAGYKLEPAVGSESTTMVVEIPVDVGNGIRTVNDVSMWEQVALAANMQRWWADNQVSCTVTFKPETEGHQIASVLDYFQYQLKGISFLPKCDFGAFPQMPYEEISESKYLELCSQIKRLHFFGDGQQPLKNDGEGEMFCDGDSCVRH